MNLNLVDKRIFDLAFNKICPDGLFQSDDLGKSLTSNQLYTQLSDALDRNSLADHVWIDDVAEILKIMIDCGRYR